jgi:pimeloyl-ACP methyl ester carboxylesterase
MGHSLGGVVAAMLYAEHEDIDALGMFASFPAAGTVTDRDGEVLSLIGSADGSASIPNAYEGFGRYPAPGFFGVIDGMNHYDWTDAATARELRRDGPSTRPLDDTRRDALRVIDAFLDAALRGDPDARARLDAGFDHVAETP